MLGHLLLVVLIIIQSRGKCLKSSAFLHVVIMGIDLLRGKKIGMAEPFRDVFHRNSLVAEKSCTAMTEIVESDMGHVVIIQKPFETCRNPVRSYQIPVFEDIDVVIEFVIVSVSEEKFHLLLALLHLAKHIDRCVTERKGTERALVLGRVLEEELILLTIGSLYDHMFDADDATRTDVHSPYVKHHEYNKEAGKQTGFQKGKHELFPFPTLETSINPNIVQNPGW